jgi:alpha-beta hydrolase superfamily lysophospholipase
VLVGGLGSSSERASVRDVDTAALGYRDDHVMQFSYRGGTTTERSYEPQDTQVDLRQSGRRLRELLERLQYDHPGVPVDVIAHSQGGLVVRSALGDELDPFDPRAPRIGTVITLGSPHHGTNAATAAALLRHTRYGPMIEAGAGALGRKRGLDPRGKSVRQMADTSDFLRRLNRRPLPNGVRVVSIAARRDLVVPSPRSHLRGATNVVVDAGGGANDHSRLPGSPAAQREMALALAGAPPTCETAADAAADALTGHAIDRAEKAAAMGAAAEGQGF